MSVDSEEETEISLGFSFSVDLFESTNSVAASFVGEDYLVLEILNRDLDLRFSGGLQGLVDGSLLMS